MLKKWFVVCIFLWGWIPSTVSAQVGSLDEMIERYPDDIELYFLRGQESLLKHHRYDEAITDFDHVLAEDKDHFEARIYRAIAYFESGQVMSAKQDALYARHNIKEDDARLNAILGIIFLEEEDYYTSADFFTRQTQLDPQNPQGYNNRARALLMLPHYEQMALDSYNKALEADPNNLTALYNRVEPLLRLGYIDEAQHSITKAIHLEPEVAGFYFRRAFIRLQLSDYERALADNYQVLRLVKENDLALLVATLTNIADIYLRQEAWQEALLYSNFILEIDAGAKEIALVNQGLALLGLYAEEHNQEFFDLAQEAFLFAIDAGFPSVVYLERRLKAANPNYNPTIIELEESEENID